MLLIWIFAVLFGTSVFASSIVLWGFGMIPAFFLGVMATLAVRGVATIVKRSLILRESIADKDDADIKTLETNRAIFWRRMLWLTFLVIAYFGFMRGVFGLGAEEALPVLSGLQVKGLGFIGTSLVV